MLIKGEFWHFESVDAVTFIWTKEGQMFDPSMVSLWASFSSRAHEVRELQLISVKDPGAVRPAVSCFRLMWSWVRERDFLSASGMRGWKEGGGERL